MSIYHALIKRYSFLQQDTYTKASMTAISHAMEELVMRFELDAEMVVTFQDFRFFLHERDKYERLAKICRQVIILARDVDWNQAPEMENIAFVEIEPQEQLANEWNIVVNHPEHPMVLTTSEAYGEGAAELDSLRVFHGFLSFDPQVVEEAVGQTVRVLAAKGFQMLRHHTILRKDRMLSVVDHRKKTALFINRLVLEVESTVSQLRDKTHLLTQALNENRELSLEMVRRLCYAAEYKDSDTASHLGRIGAYATTLYGMVQSDASRTHLMRYAAMMHDIGKIGIPDAILLKPGKLSATEFEIVKTHTKIGARILEDSSEPVMEMGREIAMHHHERWDGTGYPHGLQGEKIPLVARIVAIVDVFDALKSQRSYKKAFSVEESLQILREQRGRHFDGELTDLFLENFDMFSAMAV